MIECWSLGVSKQFWAENSHGQSSGFNVNMEDGTGNTGDITVANMCWTESGV